MKYEMKIVISIGLKIYFIILLVFLYIDYVKDINNVCLLNKLFEVLL